MALAPALHAPALLERFPLLAPLTIRDFRLYWLGRSISIAGGQIQMEALAVVGLDLPQCTVVVALALLAFHDTLTLRDLAYATVSGTVYAFFLPASNTIIPELASRERVLRATPSPAPPSA